MRLILVILFFTMILIMGDAIAQFKPSEQQYLKSENILFNSGFEQGVRSWTNSAGTFAIDNTKEVIGKNAGCVTLTAQTMDLSQTITTGYNANLSGLQGVASAYIRSTTADIQVCSLVDGAEQTCIDVKSNSSYDHYSIPTVLGGTSGGIKIKSTGAVTGEVCIDDAIFGAESLVSKITECTSSIDCENEFSAYIDSSSNVISENVDWIDSCTKVGTGTHTCTMNITLAQVPSFTCSAVQAGGNDNTCTVYNLTTSSFSVRTLRNFAATNNTPFDMSFTIKASKQSADYVKPTSSVVVKESLSPDMAGFLSFSFFDMAESSGWLKADGRCVLKTQYPDYFSNVGTLYGECTISTTNDGVNLPDMRGYFARALDNMGTPAGDGGNDPDARTLGDIQLDAFQGHLHGYTTNDWDGNGNNDRFVSASTGSLRSNVGSNNTHFDGYFQEGGKGTPRTANETRPKNIGLMAYVRMSNQNLVVGKFKENARKCQSKFLSSNLSSLGNISDLTFTSLTEGRLYTYMHTFRVESFTSGSDIQIRLENGNDGTIDLVEKQTTGTGAIDRVTLGGSGMFTADSSGIFRAELAAATGGAFIYSNRSQITLCEESSSTYLTSEW